MKILLLLLMLGVYATVSAQHSITAEAQYVRSTTDGIYPNVEITYERYIQKTIGVFTLVSHMSGFSTASVGVLLTPSVKNGKWSVALALGPGVAWVDKKIGVFENAYITLETKAGEDRAKGKLAVSVYHYYSSTDGNWNMSYFAYSLIKEFSLGAHYQDYATIGPRVQLNLPKGFTLYGVVGKHADCILGLNYSWTK